METRVHRRALQFMRALPKARWAMARGCVATEPGPNFLPHLHLDALPAVQHDRCASAGAQ